VSRDWATYTVNLPVGDIAADSDALLYALLKVPNAVKVTAVRFGCKTSVAKADTNYNTLQIKNGTVVVAAIANGPNTGAGTSFVLGTFVDGVVVTAAGADELAAGATLSLKVTKTGTGLAITGVVVQLELLDINP
jgi:hypothetical protein